MTNDRRSDMLGKARQLRTPLTPLEAILWRRLRAKRISYKFRRQHVIGPYIADFCCEEARLIIEVDGDSHVEQVAYDEARTEHMSGLGYRVLRFTNRDVLHNVEGVLEVILAECENRTRAMRR